MLKQKKMGYFFYKKIACVLAIVLLIFTVSSPYASSVMWPSAMNLYNDTLDFDKYVPEDATSSNSKKGMLFTGNLKEIFDLGCGNIAINVCLSGKSHTFLQFLEGLKKRGIKITLILVNDKETRNPLVGGTPPEEFKKPYFYMIDFNGPNGDWQKYNFDRVVRDYAPYVDNWIIGNEINSQLYNYYGASKLSDYTKVYCDSFKIMYDQIKKANENAEIYISFDQCWDMPEYNEKSYRYDKVRGPYRYNAKEQIELINKYLDKDIEWGVALHPYPAPVEESMFWDDEYAGFEEKAKEEKDRPYLITAKNFELVLYFLNQSRFLKKDKTQRKVMLSELSFTSHNGEEIQAAGIYYIWEKMMKYDMNIEALLYNAQTDLADGYNFGLTTEKGRKRIAWAVFRDMDKENENAWCKDLLDRVLEEHGYVDVDTMIYTLPKEEETK